MTRLLDFHVCNTVSCLVYNFLLPTEIEWKLYTPPPHPQKKKLWAVSSQNLLRAEIEPIKLTFDILTFQRLHFFFTSLKNCYFLIIKNNKSIYFIKHKYCIKL